MVKPALRQSPRDAILAAALDRFRAVGPHGFTMSGVAGVAGLTTPAIYRHFTGKEELLTELVTQGFALFTQYLARGLAGDTPRERLMLTCDAYLEFALDHASYYETIFLTAEIPGLNRFPEDFQRGRSQSFQLLVDRIRECIDAGELARGDAVEIALSLWAQAHGFVALQMMGRFGKNRAKIRTAYAATLNRLFEGLNA